VTSASSGLHLCLAREVPRSSKYRNDRQRKKIETQIQRNVRWGLTGTGAGDRSASRAVASAVAGIPLSIPVAVQLIFVGEIGTVVTDVTALVSIFILLTHLKICRAPFLPASGSPHPAAPVS
jgi:hypothetical protein